MVRKGILFILIATLAFAGMNTAAKELSVFHPMQVVFFRAIGTFIFVFPVMLYKGVSIVGNNPKFLLARGLVGVISLATFFIALQRIPLGSAISIRYLGPVFGAIMAYFLLKERIGLWQWISFIVAFLGVIVLKGFDIRIDVFSLGLVLVSAFFVGIVFTLLRFLGDKEHHLTIINYFMLCCIVLSLCFVYTWRMPIGSEWYYIVAIGLFGWIGQIYMTRAFKEEETSVLAPFKYMELVYALILGFLFFGEKYEVLPLMGIFLIIAGMLMNVLAKNKMLRNDTLQIK